MLIQAEEMKRAAPKPSRSDQETIAQAKRLLQATCAISEEEAHRFLQKKSMAAHRKMADVAADIVRGETRGPLSSSPGKHYDPRKHGGKRDAAPRKRCGNGGRSAR